MISGLSTTLQEKSLDALIKNGGFRFSQGFFIYTSGKIGNYYVNSEVVTKDENAYADAINSLSVLVSLIIGDDLYDVISGGESRDWIFSYPVAFHLRKQHAGLYKDWKIIGADVKEKRVVHIADLNNEGSSPRDLLVPMIRSAGGEIGDIFFFVDRLEDGIEVMKTLDLNSHAVVSLNHYARDYLLKNNAINREIYMSLLERMEDREEWARRMLRSDMGVKQFILCLKDEKMRNRVKKILDVGYPELKEEILDRLKQRDENILEIL